MMGLPSWVVLRKAAHSKGILARRPNRGIRLPRGPQGPLEQAALGERYRSARTGNDDVVEHLDVDQRERIAQCAGEQFIGPAGLGRAGRMVMRQDDGGSVEAQRFLDDLTWKNAGLCQGAVEQIAVFDQVVLRIQEEGGEDLVL